MVVRPKRKQVDDMFQILVDECEVDRVKSFKYPGLELEETLTWNNYIDNLCKKISFKVSKLSRLRKTTPKPIMIKIYNSMIQPTIDYAISVWGCTSQTNLDKVQRLQNYAARIIEKDFDYVNTRGLELVHKLGWLNVRERFFYFQTLLIFKCIYGLAPDYLNNNVILETDVNNVQTRKHPMNLYLQLPDSEFHKTMLFYRGAKGWNELPPYLKNCYDIDHFRRLLNSFIKNQRFLL